MIKRKVILLSVIIGMGIVSLTGCGRDFVPENWWVHDEVQLDFNEDGILDYIGVLQNEESYRILFAIASDGEDGYCLNFQDNNLIREDVEGGVSHLGWSHMLTAEETSFTTHVTYSDGDSEWNWLNNWESGVGIRKRRSSEPDDMEGKGNSAGYDVEYELTLDEPMTLEQVGMCALTLNRMEPDGTGKETVFEYHYPEGDTGDSIPHPELNYEISGDEIVVEVSIKGEPHQFYRMNTDGSGLRNIGQMPKELEIPEEENGIIEIYDGGGKLAITEEIMTAQVSTQDILKGNPVIYDRFRIDGWVFEWLISDYHEEGDWSLEDAVLLVSRENSTEDAQIIHVTAEGGYGTWVPAKNKFEYVDVNFDNIPDLLICTGLHGNQGLETYYCFLQTEDGFVEAPSFTDISNPAIDTENQLILSQWRNWAASHSWAEYKCQDNEFVMYRELCEEPESHSDIWVWTVNGEEVARSDELSEEEIYDFLYGENSEWKIMDDRWRTLYNNGLTADYSIYDEP